MGLVPADLHLLGLDGAGVIRRFHHAYTGPLQVGQRVLVTRKGCFSNLVQSPVNGLFPLPEWMTFEVRLPHTSEATAQFHHRMPLQYHLFIACAFMGCWTWQACDRAK